MKDEQTSLINEETKNNINRSHTPRNLPLGQGRKSNNTKDFALERAAFKEAKTARKSKKLDIKINSEPVADTSKKGIYFFGGSGNATMGGLSTGGEFFI